MEPAGGCDGPSRDCGPARRLTIELELLNPTEASDSVTRRGTIIKERNRPRLGGARKLQGIGRTSRVEYRRLVFAQPSASGP
jgi:hypothetical protein